MTTTAQRNTIYNYWAKHSHDPSVETMMLNANASVVDESDKMDIISGLPRGLDKMSVLEIGAGIGRFTPYLAKHSREVHATDFIESFIEKNRELHAKKYPHLSFGVSDAVHMEEEPSSRDLVFTNWLLMYLTDAETSAFLLNCLKWLTPGGYLHMRESCTESSTRSKSTVKSENPTHYRHVSQYLDVLSKLTWQDPTTGQMWGFHPIWARSVKTYIFAKNNWRQCQMLIQKVPLDSARSLRRASQIDDLVAMFESSYEKQICVDAGLNDRFSSKQSETDKEMKIISRLEKMCQQVGERPLTVLNLDPLGIDSFRLTEKINCSVVGVSTDHFVMSGLLSIATEREDKRVSFQWSAFQADDWRMGTFDAIIGCEAVPDGITAGQFVTCIKQSLKNDGHLLFTAKTDRSLVDLLFSEYEMLSITPTRNPRDSPTNSTAFALTPDYSSSSDEGDESISRVAQEKSPTP